MRSFLSLSCNMQCETTSKAAPTLNDRRPSFFALIGFFALALLIGILLSCLGLFHSNFAVGGSVGFVSAFVIGLVAASSSCMAVSGGLLLATAAKYNERSGSASSRGKRLKPVLLFVAGRVVAYAILGGIIGAIGKNISLSPIASGALTAFAAIVMLVLGLDMLKLLPKRLKKLMPSMPSFISRRVINAESSANPLAPLLLGAGTFFLPCGFTQALQIYALSSGSFTAGALVLGGFALGTVPALLALGAFAGSWRGNIGRFFFRLAGAAVVILGIINFGNGYNLMGLPTLSFANADPSNAIAAVPSGETQIASMAIGPGGYAPNSFTISAGSPIRWIVDATNASGCQMSIVSRQLNIQKFLNAGSNEIDFSAPSTPGTYQFSCPMGMYRGQFVVVANS